MQFEWEGAKVDSAEAEQTQLLLFQKMGKVWVKKRTQLAKQE